MYTFSILISVSIHFQLPDRPTHGSYIGDLLDDEGRSLNDKAPQPLDNPTARRALHRTFLSPATPGVIPATPGRGLTLPQPELLVSPVNRLYQPLCSPISPGPSGPVATSTPIFPSGTSVQLSTLQYSNNSESSFLKYALKPGFTSTPISQQLQSATASPLLPFQTSPYVYTRTPTARRHNLPELDEHSPRPSFLHKPYADIPTPTKHLCSSPALLFADLTNQPLDLSTAQRKHRHQELSSPPISPIVIQPLSSRVPSPIKIEAEFPERPTTTERPIVIEPLPSLPDFTPSNKISSPAAKAQCADDDRSTICFSEITENSNSSPIPCATRPTCDDRSTICFSKIMAKSNSSCEEPIPCATPPTATYRPLCSPVTPVRNTSPRHFSPMDVSPYPDPSISLRTLSPPAYSTTMTPRAQQVLEKWYMWNSPTGVPSQEVLSALSKRTGMAPAVITCWINCQRTSTSSTSASSDSKSSPLPAVVVTMPRKRRASSSPSSPCAPPAKRPTMGAASGTGNSNNQPATISRKRPVSSSPSSPAAPSAKRPYKPSVFTHAPASYTGVHPMSAAYSAFSTPQSSRSTKSDEIINFLYFIPSPCQYHLDKNSQMILNNWYHSNKSPFVPYSTVEFLAYQTGLTVENVMHWISHTVKMDAYRKFFSV